MLSLKQDKLKISLPWSLRIAYYWSDPTLQPIPLTEVLAGVSHSSSEEHLVRPKAVLLEKSTKRLQRKAEIMLQRRQQQTIQNCNLDWYLGERQVQSTLHQNTTKSKALSQWAVEPQLPSRQPTGSSPRGRKGLPRFLTASEASVVKSDLSSMPKQMPKTSCFLTDTYHHVDVSQQSSKMERPCGQQHVHSEPWQPLSQNALCEYSGVTEINTRGPGYLAHGQYKLWRPPNDIETYSWHYTDAS